MLHFLSVAAALKPQLWRWLSCYLTVHYWVYIYIYHFLSWHIIIHILLCICIARTRVHTNESEWMNKRMSELTNDQTIDRAHDTPSDTLSKPYYWLLVHFYTYTKWIRKRYAKMSFRGFFSAHFCSVLVHNQFPELLFSFRCMWTKFVVSFSFSFSLFFGT